MSRSLGREIAEELIGKAVVWTPLTAGLLLLGPVGLAVGVATGVAIACSGSSGNSSESQAARNNETGSSD
jgi:hypothetical protein